MSNLVKICCGQEACGVADGKPHRIGIARKNRIAATERIGEDHLHEQQSTIRTNKPNAQTLHPTGHASFDDPQGGCVEADSFARSAGAFLLWSDDDRSLLPAELHEPPAAAS